MRFVRLAWIILPLIAHLSAAQPPNILWDRIYGGEDSDLADDVQPTGDGGFIFACETASFGNGGYDIYIIRTDANGDTLWTHTYGGGMSDSPSSIRPTSDGGWIIAGTTMSFGAGENDMLLTKIDENGTQIWQQAYGTAGFDYGTGGEQTADGGYILCGFTTPTIFAYPDARLIKTNSTGAQVWSRTFGGEDNQEVFYDVHETPDHGFILCGYNDDFNGFGGWDAWAVKTDSLGLNPLSHLYGGFGSDAVYSIVETTDGGYAMAGFTDRDASIASDFYFVKVNANLDTVWTRNWGRVFLDEAFDLIQTSDGGYLASGHTCIPFFGNCRYDMFLVKTDANGDSLWTWQFGDGQNDAAFATRQTSDGGYIVAGYNTSPDVLDYDVHVVRLEGDCADPTPKPPQELTIHDSGDDVRLMWRPVTESLADCPLSISSYTIHSDTIATGDFITIVGSTADTMFTDVGAVPSNSRKFYQITANTP